MDFSDIEDESFVKNEFDTENAKNNVRKEERDSLEDKFLNYESKTEEEFRDLLVKGMNSFLKEIISMSKTLNSVKNDIETIGDTKALIEELRSCEEEIISLWEHIEKLADTRIDIDNKKGRV